MFFRILSWISIAAIILLIIYGGIMGGMDSLGLGTFTAMIFFLNFLFFFARAQVKQAKSAVAAKGSAVHKCASCSWESRDGKAFRREGKKLLCLPCWYKRKKSAETKSLVYMAVFLVIGAAGAFFFPGFSFPWILINLTLVWLFVMTLIIPHEAGHAVAARLLGMHIHKVVVGAGKVVGHAKVLGFPLEVKALPLGGLSHIFCKEERGFRRKLFLAVLAGPMTNLLILAALFIIAPPAPGFFTMTAVEPLAAFYAANIIVAIISLVPYKTHMLGVGEVRSDGLNLARIPRMTTAEVGKEVARYYSVKSLEARLRKHYDSAEQYLMEALALYPDNVVNMNDLGIHRLETGRYAEARTIFKDLVSRAGLEDTERLLIKNNLAYVDALIGGNLLAEADRLSEEAYRVAPWVPAFGGTRGTVLARLGRFDEGVALMKEAMELHSDRTSKAVTACLLADAERRRGDADKADEWMALADRLDSDCYLLDTLRDAGGTGADEPDFVWEPPA